MPVDLLQVDLVCSLSRGLPGEERHPEKREDIAQGGGGGGIGPGRRRGRKRERGKGRRGRRRKRRRECWFWEEAGRGKREEGGEEEGKEEGRR